MVYPHLLMTNTTIRMIFMATAGLVFCFALAYTVSTITSVSTEFNQVPEARETVYILDTEIPEEVHFTGAEVIGSLYKLNFEDNLQVNIDGVVIRNSKEFSKRQSVLNLTAEYKQTLIFGNEGNVQTIFYNIQ